MADYGNPFFQDEYVSKISKNLIDAFRPDGRDAVNAAQAKKIQTETDKLNSEGAARAQLAAAVSSLDTTAPITAEWVKNAYASGIQSGANPDVVSNTLLGVLANVGRPDTEVARAFVGTGKAINKDQGFSIPDREGIAKRENDAAFSRTKYSADSSAGATIQSARIHEAGAMDREKYKDERSIGYQFVPDPNNPSGPPVPRAVTKREMIQNGGLNPVLPNSYYEKGTDKEGKPTFGLPGAGGVTPVLPSERFVRAFDKNSPTGESYQVPKPGLPAPAPVDHTPAATPSNIADIEYNVLNNLGVWDAASKKVDSTFAQQYGEKMQSADRKSVV